MPKLREFFLLFCVVVVCYVAFSALITPTNASSYSVVGPPTVNADFINRVLSTYHSPAAGTGQAVYDLGVKYNIDPVFALAFFQHESSFGTTGVARYTRSPGNIRASAGYAEYEGYRAYQTWRAGFADWFQLIHNLYINQWGLTTVEQIVPVYAPASDNNDVEAYISSVESSVNTWRNAQV